MALDNVLSVAVLPAGAYASEIFLNQFDYHIQHDTLGSRQEYTK